MDEGSELAELRAELAHLREEVRAARDWTGIANLQAMYGYYVDKGLWDQAADLFAPDGTLEIAGRGVYVGRERVRAYLHALPPYERGALFNHMQLQPVIHVAGDTAKARWRTFIQIAWLGGVARWGEATYENAYRRVEGEWRIAALHGFITYYCEFDRGLNEGGVPLLRSINGLQPDRPPTVDYEAFPEVFVPPFHYAPPRAGGDA
ncbi:nuclear transport factor 2 family protein [Novosphingobium profundi]|uniref:nuclear transport factor 2 family protein n=1 Tax=Novosphingobium profundi TaxID=1774954 RepID=UPI001BD918E0|nr:nuclear transport factor 2 family protein [Novosphingobium profundi]MBT0670823.1 nuclear transport factor 2 family protein [Novosphingobium profundi]